jgi:hypothetical protein
MRVIHLRRAVLPALLAGVLTAVVGAPAAAQGGFDGAGAHTGKQGLHWLLDTWDAPPEYPAVTCRYTAGFKLRRLEIRPPVMFAEVSEGPRTQRVGWRAIVQSAETAGGPWSTYRNLPLVKASATGKVTAPFRPVATDLPSDVDEHVYYRVLYRLFWYGPNGTTQTGRADHRPSLYGVRGPGFNQWVARQCEALLSGVTAGVPAPPLQHTGKVGPHWILDTPGTPVEYPAVTCDYDSNGLLSRMRIRRPIVLARNTGPGVQRQDVAWKALIQYTPANSGFEEWYPFGETKTTRRSASELDWANWLPRVFDTPQPKGIIGLRVVYRMTWFKGTTNQVVGRAEHAPVAYLVDPAVGPSYVEDGYCYLSNLN